MMALPLAKLTFVLGAGYVGTVLAKGGRLSDNLSGAMKNILNLTEQGDSSLSFSKHKNEVLMQQINSLRNELQLFASSNRCITIVTESRSGARKYGLVVLVIVFGSGCIWWKGIKIPDMMFTTRRGLNDACASVAKQLETVYSSIAVVKKHLSTRINLVDSKVNECLDNTSSIKDDVPLLRGDLNQIGTDVQFIHHTVQFWLQKAKISSIEGRQDETLDGLKTLVSFAMNLETDPSTAQNEGASPTSSRPAIELSEALSLPASTSSEPPSPSHLNGRQRSHSATIGSGLKDLTAISQVSGNKDQSPPIAESSEQAAPAVLGRNFSGLWSALPRIYK